jgi:hypothetical protein
VTEIRRFTEEQMASFGYSMAELRQLARATDGAIAPALPCEPPHHHRPGPPDELPQNHRSTTEGIKGGSVQFCGSLSSLTDVHATLIRTS